MNRLTSASGLMLEIEWQREARRILLPALILPPAADGDPTSTGCTALLDTGSTTSGVARHVAQKLGLMELGRRPLSSAQGEGQAQRFLFRIGLSPARETEVPRFPFVFDDVIGFELTNAFQFEALLGMDVLSQCDFTTSRSGRCRLGFG
jgi:predicted aspartyl protease